MPDNVHLKMYQVDGKTCLNKDKCTMMIAEVAHHSNIFYMISTQFINFYVIDLIFDG